MPVLAFSPATPAMVPVFIPGIRRNCFPNSFGGIYPFVIRLPLICFRGQRGRMVFMTMVSMSPLSCSHLFVLLFLADVNPRGQDQGQDQDKSQDQHDIGHHQPYVVPYGITAGFQQFQCIKFRKQWMHGKRFNHDNQFASFSAVAANSSSDSESTLMLSRCMRYRKA